MQWRWFYMAKQRKFVRYRYMGQGCSRNRKIFLYDYLHRFGLGAGCNQQIRFGSFRKPIFLEIETMWDIITTHWKIMLRMLTAYTTYGVTQRSDPICKFYIAKDYMAEPFCATAVLTRNLKTLNSMFQGSMCVVHICIVLSALPSYCAEVSQPNRIGSMCYTVCAMRCKR